jgi:hypothetical protein
MPRTISVEIVGDASSLERSFRRASTDAAKFDRSIGRTFRGVAAGSGVFRSLGRSVAFASSAFLGGAGFVAAITSTVKAAEESQRVLGQTRVAVERSGLAWRTYRRRIEEVSKATSQLSGFDDERLLATFDTLVRRTGDVNQALRLNALAADVARGRNIELEQASQLVLKASIGNVGALRRLGINIDKNADAVQALDLLQRKYAGSAAAYGRTAAGAQDRFRVALENLQEVLGQQLLPTISKYLNRAANWLNNSRNQREILRTVRQAVAALSDALRILGSVMRGLNDVTGSTRNTVRLLLAAFVGFKTFQIVGTMAGVARSVGLIGRNAAFSARAMRGLRASILGAAAANVALGGSGARGDPQNKWSLGGILHAVDPRNWLKDIGAVFGVPTGGRPAGPLAGHQWPANLFAPAARHPAGFRLPPGPLISPTIPGTVTGAVDTPGGLRAARLRLPGRISGAVATPGLMRPPQRVSGSYQFYRPSFDFPAGLQLQQARAEALGLSIRPILLRMRAAAYRALHSGRLAVEAQTQAWDAIKSINDQLKQGAQDAARAQRRQALRYGAAAGSQYQFAYARGGPTIHIEHFYSSASNPRALENDLVRRAKARAHVRRGAR